GRVAADEDGGVAGDAQADVLGGRVHREADRGDDVVTLVEAVPLDLERAAGVGAVVGDAVHLAERGDLDGAVVAAGVSLRAALALVSALARAAGVALAGVALAGVAL